MPSTGTSGRDTVACGGLKGLFGFSDYCCRQTRKYNTPTDVDIGVDALPTPIPVDMIDLIDTVKDSPGQRREVYMPRAVFHPSGTNLDARSQLKCRLCMARTKCWHNPTVTHPPHRCFHNHNINHVVVHDRRRDHDHHDDRWRWPCAF